MQVHIIREVSPGPDHPRISPMHRVLFHGDATRDGLDILEAPMVLQSNDERSPLELTRTGNDIPEIFCPWISWVISERVRQRMAAYRGCEFLPVEFTRLYQHEIFPPGDFSWYAPNDEWRQRNPPDVIDFLPDVPEFHESTGPYYELLVPRTFDVSPQYSRLSHINVHVGSITDMDVETDVCNEMFADYPVLIYAGAYLLSDTAFAAICEFIDWEYFVELEIELQE